MNSGSWASYNHAGWVSSASNIETWHTPFANGGNTYVASDGDYLVELSPSSSSYIYSTITAISTQATFSYDHGNRTGVVEELDFYVIELNGAFDTVVEDATANEFVFATGDDSIVYSDTHSTSTTLSTSAADWTQQSGVFNTVAGQDYAIVFSSATLDAGAMGNLIDNVEVAAVVPEPSSVALLALGGLALISRRKR